MRALPLLLASALLLAAPAPAPAQLFFAARPSPGLEIGPLTIRATVSPEPGPVRVRVMFGLMHATGAAAGMPAPDLYLLWPGEVKGDATLGAPDAALAREVADVGVDVVGEGRLALFSRHFNGTPGPGGREPVPGGAPYVTFVQTSASLGLSPPATWIRIPSSPRLVDAERVMVLEVASLSLVKPKPGTWIEHWVLGERRLFAMSFNEARGRPLFRMYLAHRDRLVRLGDAPAEMAVNFPEANHLKIDSVTPPTAVRALSASLERTEVVSLFLDTGESAVPQRLTVQYGYFSRWQSTGVVVVPLVILLLGYAVGPLVGRASLHVAQRMAGRVHVSGWKGMPRERRTGVVLSRDVLARIVPGVTTYDEVLRLCGLDAEIGERFPPSDRRTVVYRGRLVRPQIRRVVGWFSAVKYLEVERHEVTIDFEGDIVRDVQADIRRSRVPAGETPP